LSLARLPIPPHRLLTTEHWFRFTPGEATPAESRFGSPVVRPISLPAGFKWKYIGDGVEGASVQSSVQFSQFRIRRIRLIRSEAVALVRTMRVASQTLWTFRDKEWLSRVEVFAIRSWGPEPVRPQRPDRPMDTNNNPIPNPPPWQNQLAVALPMPRAGIAGISQNRQARQGRMRGFHAFCVFFTRVGKGKPARGGSRLRASIAGASARSGGGRART
jgi:hypothetical protein